MGLGGRRERQRITDDPRNTKWINDESSPGQRLLRSMGWTPDSDSETPKTGLMAFSGTKRLRAIPLPKTGMEGIGFRQNGPGAASATGALPSSTSGSMASAASNMFSKLGSKAALQFVSAGASNEVINRAKTEGGEFASLLSRLNASASATSAATDTEQDEEDRENQPVQACEKAERKEQKKKRKLEKEAKREAKRARKEAGIAAVKPEDAQPDLKQEQIEIIQAALTEVAARPTIHNPRNAYVCVSPIWLQYQADQFAQISSQKSCLETHAACGRKRSRRNPGHCTYATLRCFHPRSCISVSRSLLLIFVCCAFERSEPFTFRYHIRQFEHAHRRQHR